MPQKPITPSLDIVVVGCAGTFDHILVLERLPDRTISLIPHRAVPKDIHKLQYGGCSFNIARTAQSLGLKVGVINPVGTDFKPSGYWDYLVEHGIDTEGLIIQEKTPSGHCYIWQDIEGRTLMVSYSTTEILNSLDPEPYFGYVDRAKALIIGPNFTEFSLLLGEHARSQGKSIFLSSPIAGLPQKDQAVRLLSVADGIFCNEYELGLLVRELNLENPKELLSFGLKVITFTHGSKGSTIITPEGEYSIPVVPAKKFVDPTGAGDSFAGAASAAMLMGYSPLTAARIGAVVSSYVVEKLGTQTNLPDWKKMIARYEEQFGPFEDITI